MVRKIIIALAAITFAGAAASTTADARMGGGGGFHGGGFHGGMGGGFRGAAIGGGFRGAPIGGGFRGAAIGGGFHRAAIGGGFRSAAFRGGLVGPGASRSGQDLHRASTGLLSLVSIDSIIAASSPLPRRRSSQASACTAARAGVGNRHRGAGSESGPATTTMATTKRSPTAPPSRGPCGDGGEDERASEREALASSPTLRERFIGDHADDSEQ
jgi:hypothetical protein